MRCLEECPVSGGLLGFLPTKKQQVPPHGSQLRGSQKLVMVLDVAKELEVQAGNVRGLPGVFKTLKKVAL